jgi:osmoprotectant transport system permease protein
VRRGLTARLFLWPTVALVAYVVAVSMPGVWAAVLHALFPAEVRVLYQQATMYELIARTLQLVVISSTFSIVVGVSAGVFVTRPAGAEFRDVVTDLVNLGQTFPPVAVFTLAVPLLGFGVLPTVVALTFYGVLPVLQNTIAGMEALPREVLESASAMGFGRWQRLVRVELPLAAPVILAGIRVSVVINVATSTIGAVAGAGGLGAPIISGLILSDPAVSLQGAVLTACLALIIDSYLGAFEHAAARSVGIRAD